MMSEKTRGVWSCEAAVRISSPKPLPPPRNSACDRAGHDADRGDLQTGEEVRQPGRKLELDQRLPAARTHGLEQHAGVLVGGVKAGRGSHHDRERRDERSERDFRRNAEAEPGDEDRREGDFRHRVDRDEIRHDRPLAERGFADNHS